MKTLLAILVTFIGFSLVAVDADARRFGGGRNLGMQRSAPAQPQKAAPAQQQQPQQQAAPAQQPQPTGASKWLGPLAGLALGAGLAALFLNNGMAGLLAGMLLIGLIAAALFFLGRALLGRQSQRPLQYAGMPGAEARLAGLGGAAGCSSRGGRSAFGGGHDRRGAGRPRRSRVPAARQAQFRAAARGS
jgi:predicted lipid-binding transport protein (Tim44 family)